MVLDGNQWVYQFLLCFCIGGSTAVTISDALSNVNTMRILSSNAPTWTNADVVQQLISVILMHLQH
jgi:hypothetical protein